MKISIIAAMAKNRVIGVGNSLPWNLKEDMDYFKKITLNKTVIMGQKTFESIGKPLPKRKNIILTKEKDYSPGGCFTAKSIEDSLKTINPEEEVMIIGGASVYKQFLPLADKMYLTIIDKDFDGDVFFPDFDYNEWKEVSRVDKENKNLNLKYSFIILKKIKIC
jgi:dihydrofolate reductase